MHHYATRSQSKSSSPTSEPGYTSGPHLFSLNRKRKVQGHTLAVSSSESHESFLKQMGVISADVTVRTEPLLTDRDVSLLTCAMSHVLIEEDHLHILPKMSGRKL